MEKEEIINIHFFLEQLAIVSLELLELNIFLKENEIFKNITNTNEICFENMVDKKKPILSFELHCELKKEYREMHTLGLGFELFFSDKWNINSYIHWIAYDGLGEDVYEENKKYDSFTNFSKNIESELLICKEELFKVIDCLVPR
ncbi:hypothetical protein [Aquimarina algiphila]|uniref:hypothetical protein n=1 Tax=Aquimarina algiphila TaxID=2047982 RepID=UPI00232B8A6A|nr:hypothetical protein [Aquimarina algiphila]